MPDLLYQLEVIATISGIIAVALQARERLLAWPIAIISVTAAAFIFYQSKLYSDFGLHVIYIFLNIYGWYIWTKRGVENQVATTKVLSIGSLVKYVLLVFLGMIILGGLMQTYTDADLAYFDAFTTAGSLVAQYLLAKKYLQNWLFWIVVDAVAIPVYLYKELYYFSFLFFIYLIICIWGYYAWKQKLRNNINI